MEVRRNCFDHPCWVIEGQRRVKGKTVGGRTFVGDRDVRGEVVETLLNHSPGSITRRVYDRSKLLKPMLDACEMWSLHLGSLRS